MGNRVLVAEDNPAVNEVVSLALEAAGYDCTRVCDGLEALRAFEETTPAAVILDLNLPALHGLEVLRAIKNARPEVVVIVLTGHGTEQTSIRALKLGADDYLQKPVRAAVLTASLQRNLERVARERRADTRGAAWSRVSEGRLSSVFFAAPTPLIYADEEGAAVAVNQAAARLLGVAPDELLGRRIDAFVDAAVQENWLDTLRREAKSGRGYSAEVFLRGAGQQPVPVHTVAVAGPEQGFLLLALRDLTQQKALESHYFEAKKLASLGRVVEGVAHEVRNPLVSIGGFARKLLESFGDRERESKYLEVILSDVRRLERMVQEIEGYVSFTNRHRPAFGPVDVGAIFTSAVRRVRERFPALGVRIYSEGAEDLPTIFGDEGLLGELFEGLVENSFEAMPAGGDLTAIWEAEGNWARIRLTDSGIGISPDDLGEIFNPFFTTKTSGAGLGLAKAYMIVEEHSGTIEFESTPGRGTACSISLPIDRRALKRTKP